jgi:glycosyltransferase involved in cell wall biosynthesis
VLPSEYDGCPAVVSEAMLCGLPVILSDQVRGRFELIDEGRTGFIYPCGDIEELSGLLRRTMSDPVRLKTMSAAARQMMETCSPDTSVRDFIRLLDGIFPAPSSVRLAQTNEQR